MQLRSLNDENDSAVRPFGDHPGRTRKPAGPSQGACHPHLNGTDENFHHVDNAIALFAYRPYGLGMHIDFFVIGRVAAVAARAMMCMCCRMPA